MTQFEPTGEQIAREVDLERYGDDPEKARMRADIATLVQMGADQANEILGLRAALEAISEIVAHPYTEEDPVYTLRWPRSRNSPAKDWHRERQTGHRLSWVSQGR